MKDRQQYLRFTLYERIEHWLLVISFTLLAITGLSQRFASSPLSVWLIKTLGGIETVRVIHRISAVTLALLAIYHLGTLIYCWYVKQKPLTIFPNFDDVTNAWNQLLFNLNMKSERPQQGFFTFEEKVEYWALIWGIVIMGLTGFFLWNPITAAEIFPGQFIPAAKAAHGNEALLAVLAIFIWHWYHVLIRHFNTSMFTGYLSKKEMEEEHPLVLESDVIQKEQKNGHTKKRTTIFWVVYGAFAVLLLIGLFWFATSEQTATAEAAPIPDVKDLEVYTPLTSTPLPTKLPTPEIKIVIGTSWKDGIGDFIGSRCGGCHNPLSGRANLDLTSYEGLLKGGDSGPAVVPYAPGISHIILWQRFDWHEVKFSPAEEAILREWIANGAPEE